MKLGITPPPPTEKAKKRKPEPESNENENGEQKKKKTKVEKPQQQQQQALRQPKENFLTTPYENKMRTPTDREIHNALESGDNYQISSLIAKLGTKKQLDDVFKIYSGLYYYNIQPTVYIFTNIINGCVRCGELSKAKKVLREMKKYRIRANDITYTVLLKGFCNEGFMNDGVDIYNEMIRKKWRPNIRTFNTILRGILRNGSIETSNFIYDQMKSMKIEFDLTTYEYLIKIYCQEGDIERAMEIMNEMNEKQIKSGPAYVALAIAQALAGKFEDAKQSVSLAEKITKETTNSEQFIHTGKEKTSVPLFLKLRNDEVLKDCATITKFLNNQNKSISDSTSVRTSSRVVLFPQPLSINENNNNNNNKKDNKKEKEEVTEEMEEEEEKVKEMNKVDDKNKEIVRFEELFKETILPIKIEVCSGNGDWIIDKAMQHPEYNWIAVEIRFERVYQIWYKMIFNNVKNLVILGGEAHSIFKNYIGDKTINEVYVNYPDPPVWEESKQRLIDQPFLQEVHRTLEPNRSIILVTDDEPYCNVMAQEFIKIPDLYVTICFI